MSNLTDLPRRRRGVLRNATATVAAAALLTLPGTAGARPATVDAEGRESARVMRLMPTATAARVTCQARAARVARTCGGGSGGRSYGGDPFRYDEPGAWNGGRDCSGGYTRGAESLKRWLQRRYNRTRTIGGYACRPNTANTSQMSLHAEGRALDWMISAHRPRSRRIVRRFIGRVAAENWRLGRAMGLQEIIWNGRIWTSARHSEGWRAYTGPNPHTDHVHIGMNWPGARKRTSFWR